MTKRIIIVGLILLALLLIRPVGPVYGQSVEPQANEHKLFVPFIMNPFSGTVELNCPPGSDATVTFDAFSPLPGLIFGIWTLYDHDELEVFLVPTFPYPVLDGYGAAVFDLHQSRYNIVRFDWYSSTPIRVTGSGCFYIEGIPVPPNAQL